MQLSTIFNLMVTFIFFIVMKMGWSIDYRIILIIDYGKLLIHYEKGKTIFLANIPPYAIL